MDFRSCRRRFAGKIDFRRGRRAIEKVFSSFEPAASQVGNTGQGQRGKRGGSHHHARYLEIKTVRTDQQHANQRGVHGVVPNEGCQDAPAQHHHPGNNADDAHLNPTNVTRLLRIGAVQKTPGKRRQDDRQDSGLGHPLHKGDGKKAEEKFLAGGGHETDGHARDPGKRRVHRIGVVQILGCPNSKAAAHQVEGDNEADVTRCQGQPDNG